MAYNQSGLRVTRLRFTAALTTHRLVPMGMDRGSTPAIDQLLSFNRAATIQSIHTPLGFFVLSLFIIELFIFAAGVWFPVPEIWRIILLLVGIAIFLLIVGGVYCLVLFKPENLVFSETSHLQVRQMAYGTDRRPFSETTLEALPSVLAPNNTTPQLPAPRQDS
jgi:hypothetical protein